MWNSCQSGRRVHTAVQSNYRMKQTAAHSYSHRVQYCYRRSPWILLKIWFQPKIFLSNERLRGGNVESFLGSWCTTIEERTSSRSARNPLKYCSQAWLVSRSYCFTVVVQLCTICYSFLLTLKGQKSTSNFGVWLRQRRCLPLDQQWSLYKTW